MVGHASSLVMMIFQIHASIRVSTNITKYLNLFYLSIEDD